MAEGQTPGNGYVAPFGDGDGATQADGPASGAHDFVADPKSNSPQTGGRDFTKESKPQHAGQPGYNPASVPGGGALPFPAADPANRFGQIGTMQDHETHKPFTLKGEGGGGMPEGGSEG